MLAGSHFVAARTAKTPHTATAKAADKATRGGKHAAAKSRDKKSHKTAEAAAHKDSPPAPTVPPPLETSDPDVALVRTAIDGLRKGGASKATGIEATIADPAARKLVEWIILRSDGNGVGSARYMAFIAANPGWPSLALFRRRAEAMLWNEHPKPAQVLAFFKESPPQSGMGRLVLARALLAQGDTDRGSALVREAWRYDALSADVEKQVLVSYSELLSRVDHKARMEKRLFAADNEAALRAAHRLGSADLAIARVRIALHGKSATSGKSGNSGKSAKRGKGGKDSKDSSVAKLLKDVPEEAHEDPGFLFAYAHVLRHENKIAEAARVILSAPRDPVEIGDPEEWWVERRILARKLIDIGDARSAYLLMRDAAEPIKENSRVERLFMAGWIALRFLDDPATAATHFARIPEVSNHPTSLGRAHYWLGRTAEAAHQPDLARAEYRAAAYSSAAYYGQLARARLGLEALALAGPPPTPDKQAAPEPFELVRALEILYTLREQSLVIPLMADAGGGVDDVGTLSALGELSEQQQDARGMLHLGKAALARGLPLDYYAFPTVGVPRYSPIAPEIGNAVLFAIIRQESMFNPADWSAAQAMGLMQVTPSAGQDTCKRFSCKYDVKRLKNDSPYNLQLGAAELAGLFQDYRGNYILTFAAYNAGRGRVTEWIGRFGDPRDPKVDPVDWVERIPFSETRNYVQRIMENVQVYRTRFGDNAPLIIESDLRRGAAAN